MHSIIEKNVSLKEYNTFGIDAKAKFFAKFKNVGELRAILEDPLAAGKEMMILGGGSNILLTKDFDGVILKNEVPGIQVIKETDANYYVQAGAGVNWHAFVEHCLANNYAGVENLSLIPGNVGAAPMQNIGAYGVEVKDFFYELEAYNLETKEIVRLNNEACQFGYRESIFKNELKNKCIILHVTFKLDKKPIFRISYGAIQSELEKLGEKPLSIQAISKAVINIRQSKLPDPTVIGNAGSFFKNPVVDRKFADELKEKFPEMVIYPVGENESKIAAGWLIDSLGWKGKVFDNHGVHDQQALVLVNHGGASGKEIFDLSAKIVDSVQLNYGIKLQREVNIY